MLYLPVTVDEGLSREVTLADFRRMIIPTILVNLAVLLPSQIVPKSFFTSTTLGIVMYAIFFFSTIAGNIEVTILNYRQLAALPIRLIAFFLVIALAAQFTPSVIEIPLIAARLVAVFATSLLELLLIYDAATRSATLLTYVSKYFPLESAKTVVKAPSLLKICLYLLCWCVIMFIVFYASLIIFARLPLLFDCGGFDCLDRGFAILFLWFIVDAGIAIGLTNQFFAQIEKQLRKHKQHQLEVSGTQSTEL